MPSKSPAQARLMAACSHGAGYASCPPAKVSKEFNEADKGGNMLKGKRKHTKRAPSEMARAMLHAKPK